MTHESSAESRHPLSGERHYFGFNLWHLSPTGQCQPGAVPGVRGQCRFRARYQARFAYVRERDQQPTYVSAPVCDDHARRFADEWGLSLPAEEVASV